MNTKLALLLSAAVTSLVANAALAQPTAPPPVPPPAPPLRSLEAQPSALPTNNYEIAIEIRQADNPPDVLKVVTTEGRVTLDTDTGRTVEIDSSKFPITMNLTGTLKTLTPETCKLDLFLGWTMPYVTGTSVVPGGKTSSTVQQTRVGLQTTVVLSLGESLVIQSNALRKITVTLNEVPPAKRR